MSDQLGVTYEIQLVINHSPHADTGKAQAQLQALLDALEKSEAKYIGALRTCGAKAATIDSKNRRIAEKDARIDELEVMHNFGTSQEQVALDELALLRALVKSFLYEWGQSELGELNGSRYFAAVHALRQAVA